MTLNYYEILEIDCHASAEEIRSSFRKKVMEHHPDRNPDDRQGAEEKVRLVIEAYRVLADPEQRTRHDRRIHPEPGAQHETVWDRIRRRDHDPGALSRLVLHELLEGHGPKGVELYESLMRDFIDFDLLPYLDLKDYLDCRFLLAEEYEHQGNLTVAEAMYREVYREEVEPPRLCCFFDEVKLRLRKLYLKDLVRDADPATALRYYSDALEMGLDRADRAFTHKKMAECYFKLGELDKARAALLEAFRIQPRIKGARRICEKLGMSG